MKFANLVMCNNNTKRRLRKIMKSTNGRYIALNLALPILVTTYSFIIELLVPASSSSSLVHLGSLNPIKKNNNDKLLNVKALKKICARAQPLKLPIRKLSTVSSEPHVDNRHISIVTYWMM